VFLQMKQRFVQVSTHKLRLLALALLSLVGKEASALDFAAGFSAIEEGDDRLRPGALVHVGVNDAYRGRLHVYGRDYGPVTERSYLVSGVRSFTPFKSQMLRAAFGVAILSEQTTVKYSSDAVQDQNSSDNNLNLGGIFSIGLKFPSGPLYFSADWDSHVFPAGVGGIFLSSGRKQTISVAMGVTLK
jgi:hypothetical protein